MVAELGVQQTPIPGMLVFDLPVHGDSRGWFKENWQREKMLRLGLPDFSPVQNNVSFNAVKGVTRGIHAEPWDKFVSVASGAVFGAWVDLRAGNTFGETFWTTISPGVAVFVPRGVGNSFQTLDDNTAYTYLVNEHWTEAARDQYTFVNLGDSSVGVPWPVPLKEAVLSDADRSHPLLAQVSPSPVARILVTGGSGQLGKALSEQWQHRNDVDITTRDSLDLSDPSSFDSFDFTHYRTIVNAAAYTNVDAAETKSGRRDSWAVNVDGVAKLAGVARDNNATLVQVSSDYVFDGTRTSHVESETVRPLGFYGYSKAASELLALALPSHYVIRTSWLIGDGHNFVRVMKKLAGTGVNPMVVDDQYGRLCFTDELARAISHLISSHAPVGIYNMSNSGSTLSWAKIASLVFELLGDDPDRVQQVSTLKYASTKDFYADRPRHSTFDLSKLRSTGFEPEDQVEALKRYLHAES